MDPMSWGAKHFFPHIFDVVSRVGENITFYYLKMGRPVPAGQFPPREYVPENFDSCL